MFDDLRKQLNQTRVDQQNRDLSLRAAVARLNAVQQALKQAQRTEDQDALGKLKQEEAGLQEQIASFQAQQRELVAQVSKISDQYISAIGAAQDELPGIKSSYPIALLPVRLETRFMTGKNGPELWVRIYPDDIAIETHETPLTSQELDAGKAYWKSVFAAGEDQDKQKQSWANLVSLVGTTRAAWVTQVLKPTLGEAVGSELVFPEVELRGASWSQPARSRVLPDRFVVITFQRGKQIHSQPGGLIPSPLIVGPDPMSKGLKPEDGKLTIPPELQWLVDFNAALALGMAVKIPLTPEQAEVGFDQVMVLGVRTSSDAIESAELLKTLFDSHHYTDGLSLIPTGTPTNYTESGPPGSEPAEVSPEESWRVEQGTSLFMPQRKAGDFENQLDFGQQRDGQRLAEALGVPYETFQHVRYADNTDALEGRAMNNALWPATLGYYLKEMVTPIGEEQNFVEPIRQLRQFMVDYVSGRGPLSAFRIGMQPYGVVLATASPQFWENSLRGTGIVPEVVRSLEQLWEALSQQVARVDFGNDPDQTMLDILALHPSSVEFYQRHASTATMMRNYLILNDFGPMALSAEEERVAQAMLLLSQINLQQLLPTNIMTLLWFKRATLLDGPLVDEGPPSEVKLLRQAAAEGNYIDWILKQDVAALRDSDFGKDEHGNPRPVPRALLYLLLNQAMQREQIDTTMKLRQQEQKPVFHKELQFINIRVPKQQTVWHYLAEPLNISGTTPAGLFLMTGDLSNLTKSRELQALRQSLGVLSKLSTARLERLLTEHLDLCSYRLDAWLTGLLYQQLTDRLRRLRIELDGENYRSLRSGGRGVYIGAYGYLENLRPATRSQPVPQNEIPEGFSEGAPLVYAPDNQGYIHAPSLMQATTAAVLRNAYLTHASSANRGMMAVNLSSARTRKAQWFLEGMRAGQKVAALLGYQFERALHEQHLDQYLMLFRQQFPFELDASKQPLNTSVEALAARNVVNGQALVQAHQQSGFPYGIAALQGIPAGDQTAIRGLVQDVADSLDAIADLALAEGVHQAALGKHERAAAILDAVNRGGYPPEVEFVRTLRSGSALTVCVGLVLDGAISVNLKWPASVPRAKSEPRLNAWLDKILGDPASIRCRGQIDGQVQSVEVTAAELAISAVDFVMTAGDDATTVSALERRIDYALRRREGLADDHKVTLDLVNPDPVWGAGIKTFFEVLPLTRALRHTLSECRPMSAEDLLPQQEVVPDENDRRHINLVELEARANSARTALQQTRDDLANAQTAAKLGGGELVDLDKLRVALSAAAAFGLPDFPSSATGSGVKVLKTLSDQADSALKGLDARLKDAQDAVAKAGAIPIAQADGRAEALRSIFDAVFGRVLKVLPLFSLHNPPEIIQSLGAQSALLDEAPPLAVDEWLHGLTRVRTRVSHIEEVRLFAELFAEGIGDLLHFTPVQVPYIPGARWSPLSLGADLPPGNVRALALLLPDTYQASASQCGLMIDDWVEVIPNREETTGITFHFDQPNSEPPQALLLALPPTVNDSNWRWDDLVATVLGVFNKAKWRTVDTDQIDTTGWAQFLPALVSAVTPSIATASLNLLKNSSLFNKYFGEVVNHERP